MPDLVRREGVPLVSTGTFKLSTGEHTFTQEDMRAAVDALKDPAVKLPRIKLDGLAASFDPDAHGGEPAFGYVDNLRLTEDGQTVIGDYFIPDWLDAVVDWAYPARSIEGPPRGWVSPTGRAHDLVITAVALLGVDLPGVTTLPDLKDLLANGPATTNAPTEVLARMSRPDIRASLDQDIVRSRFVDQLDSGGVNLPEGADPWSWWPCSIRIDDGGKPYMIVKDESEGRIYRVDFTVNGNEVTFSDPVEQIEQYVAASSGTKPHRQVAVWASKAESRPDPHPKEESSMDPKKLRESIGLAENASDEDVTARLAALAARPEQVEDAVPAAEVDTRVEEAVAAARKEERDRIASSGGKVVEEAELAQLRDDARAGREARDTQVKAERERFVDDAIQAGKFPPARRGFHLSLLEKDPDGHKEFIDGLEAGGALNVTERGSARDDEELLAAAGDGTGWFAHKLDSQKGA